MRIAGEPAGLGERVLRLFEGQGFARVETPVLQPAELFLDMSGEEIRRRLFLTHSADGREFCLRPDHTIPICARHLASGRSRGDYAYLGPVFRQRQDGSPEIVQVGLESLGREDVAASVDADMLALALDGVAVVHPDGATVRIGDVGLLGAVLDGLDLAPPQRRRILRGIAAGGRAAALGQEDRNGGPAYAGLLAAIAGQDPKAARAFVEDVISIAGVSRVGGRSAAEIADRFLSKAENRSGTLPERAGAVLARYLAIEGGLDASAVSLRELARDERLDLAAAIDRFEDRTGFIDAHRIPLERVSFSADFARLLDYYTGFVFEVRTAARPDGPYIAGGGRYDRLLAEMGAGAPVPAVGCSLSLPGLEGAGR